MFEIIVAIFTVANIAILLVYSTYVLEYHLIHYIKFNSIQFEVQSV